MTTTASPDASDDQDDRDARDARDADRSTVERFVEQHEWVDQVARTGWLSRGIVYLVFGLLAIPIALQGDGSPAASQTGPSGGSSGGSGEEASPSGALVRILDIPAGRLLLGVLVVGMVLYIAFQILSLVLIVESTLGAWWRRAGHLIAAGMYSVFAWSAAQLVLDPEPSAGESLVERLSMAVLDVPMGRVLVGVAGLVTVGVGGYFFYRHVIERGFVEGLTSAGADPTDEDASDGTVVAIGLAGWTGRSIVIALIGFFLVRAAWTFDPDDARGFDRALREAATTPLGTVLVSIAAVGLAAYGAFCIASHRQRTVRDNESEHRSGDATADAVSES